MKSGNSIYAPVHLKSFSKSALFIALIALLGYCGKKSSVEEIEVEQPADARTVEARDIPNQYVVILQEKSVLAVGKKRDADRKAQHKMNESVRGSIRDSLDAILKKYNLQIDKKHILTDVVVGFKARLTDAQARAMKQDKKLSVYPDFTVKLRNPIQQSEPIASRNPIQQEYDIVNPTNGLTCAVNQAGGPKDATGKTTYVWVLDTGVQLDHEDLNVVTDSDLAISFIPGDPSPNDYNGHGTHVAGIIGAKDDTIGVVGVSAGARIVPVKVLENNGSGAWSYVLLGLEHVARYNSPGDVVNLSLGAFEPTLCNQQNNSAYQVMDNILQALAADNTYIVIASGNEGNQARNSMPACMDQNNTNTIFAVAAVDCSSNCWQYSNFGQPPVYWVAVGTNVLSTYKNNNYVIMSGTSMATAMVSGIIHANGGPPESSTTITCKGKPHGLAKVR